MAEKRRWYNADPDQVRAAIRFAVAIMVADAVMLLVYGTTITAAIGSFAVIVILFFLDFDGSFRERLVGTVTATAVGLFGVMIGCLVSPSTVASVITAFLVAAVFCFIRVLHGYVAKSAVGLVISFFLPVMVSATPAQLPEFAGAWLLGSGLAISATLFLLPRQRSGRVRAALATWLNKAADLTRALGRGSDLTEHVEELHSAQSALQHQLHDGSALPGAVGRRQRALALMVEQARSSQPVADMLIPLPDEDKSTLASTSADAYATAGALISGEKVEGSMPDVPLARAADLDDLAGAHTDQVLAHYPVRLMSLIAMSQLWLAGITRGIVAPRPDVGEITEQSTWGTLVADLHWRSVWMRNALRTGLGAAGCVFLVRELGLNHGLWVLLAALACFQGAFSASATWRSLVQIAAGSAAGVLVAGALLMVSTPRLAFIVLLPLSALLAKFAKERSLRLAQFTYTPFALVNLAVLEWPPEMGAAAVRVFDIVLGACVAAVITLLVFPNGIGPLIVRLQEVALLTSEEYLASRITAARGQLAEAPIERTTCTQAIVAFEHAVEAGYLGAPQTHDPVLKSRERAAALARDRLVGGDVCADLAPRRTEPGMPVVCDAIASWWETFLSSRSPEPRLG